MKNIILKRMSLCLRKADGHRAKGEYLTAMFWIGGAIQVGLLSAQFWDAGLISEDEQNEIGRKLDRARIMWDVISEESEGGTQGNPSLTRDEVEAFETYLEENAIL